MQQRSETWASLAVRGRFKMDTVAVIGGVSYSAISAPVIDRALFTDTPSVGHCVAASMMVSVLTDDVIPAGAQVEIKSRLYDDTRVSEWRTAGTYYVDRREENNGLVTLQCYDAMVKATQPYVDPSNPDDRIGWPKSMAACVTECAARIGVELDSRTVIKTGDPYQVAYPTNYTMQQVLEFIAACHGGNWIITPENKLRLIPLVPPPEETFDIIDYEYRKIMTNDGYKLVWQHYETDETLVNTADGDLLNVPVVIGKITTAKSITINRVTLARDEELGYTIADDEDSTGVELRIESNPYACQAICEDLYAALHGLEYRPFTITQACYDPCAELGDWILVGDQVRSVICTQRVTLGVDFRADVTAPGKDETGSEYPYLTAIQRLQQEDERLRKYMEAAKTEINSKIEQTYTSILLEVAGTYATGEYVRANLTILENSITSEVTRATAAEQQLSSSITQTAESITSEVTRATSAEQQLSSSISQTAEKIDLKVSKGDVSSQISMESGQVSINANRFSVDSDNFKLSRTGNLEATNAALTGSFITSSGQRKLELNSGGLNLYQNDELVGTIRGDARANQTTGDSTALPVMAIKVESGSNGLIFVSNGIYHFVYNTGLNPEDREERFWFGDTVYFRDAAKFGGGIKLVSDSYEVTLYSGYHYGGSSGESYNFLGIRDSLSVDEHLRVDGTAEFTGAVSCKVGITCKDNINCEKSIVLGSGTNHVTVSRKYSSGGEQYFHSDGSIWASGNIYADGEKYRVVQTEHYDRIGLNAMESTYAVFSDLGSAMLDETGEAYVFFDPDFAETIDLSHDYQVFVTPTSTGIFQYAEKRRSHFVAHGTPGMTLDWIVYARQKGYVNHRLERVTVGPGDPNMAAGLWPTQNTDDTDGYFPLEDTGDVIDELEAQYLAQYEREVYGYDN